MRIQTGYFATPEKPYQRSKVHLYDIVNGKPLCHSRIGADKKFHWCSTGIYMPYVECKICKEKGLEWTRKN